MANKTYYYIITATVGDNGTEWDLDPYTEEARFPDGTVWNNETEEWEDHDTNENDALSQELTKSLIRMLG